MSDEQQELEALRHELAQLRVGLQALETKPANNNGAFWEMMLARMKAEMEKEGQKASVGIIRAAVYLDRKGGKGVANSENVMGSPDKLPDEEKVIAFCTSLSNPLAVRTLYVLFRRVYEGVYEEKWAEMDKSDLAFALGVSEADLEEACRPLVANSTLRWGKHADGREYYRIERMDLVPLLLTFA